MTYFPQDGVTESEGMGLHERDNYFPQSDLILEGGRGGDNQKDESECSKEFPRNSLVIFHLLSRDLTSLTRPV